MVASYITKLLCTLDNIKSYHWSCRSYARHKASDELHSTLSKLVDQFVEVKLGQDNERPTFGDDDIVQVKNWSDEDAVVFLEEFCAWLASDLSEIAGDSLSLNHIIEEMSSAVHQALYLYTFS